MKIPNLRRRPKVETPIEQWTGKQDLITKSMRYALMGGIAAGALALMLILLGFGGTSQSASTSKVGATVSAQDQAVASDLAQEFVVTWLEATNGEESSLAAFVRTDGLRLPLNQAFSATDPRVAGIEEFEPSTVSKPGGVTANGVPVRDERQVFSVTVSVSVADARDPAAVSERRFFAVPVMITEDGAARAIAIPSPVPAPPTGDDVTLGYRYRVSANHAVAVSAQKFLAAMTSGEGEVSRYTTPGSALRAITPPLYSGVKLLDVASDTDFNAKGADSVPKDGAMSRILVTAELTVSAQKSMTAQYALTVAARGGRWEVSAIDPQPLLPAPRSKSGDPVSSTSSPGSTTESSAPSSSGTSTTSPVN